MPSNGRAPCSLLSRMRAPRCFSASAACSCDRRDVWYMVYSCYLFRFLSYYSMARVDVVTSAPCLSSRSTVSWSSQIRRAVCTSVVEADVSVWPRCFLAVCLQLCCVRSLIDIYITGSLPVVRAARPPGGASHGHNNLLARGAARFNKTIILLRIVLLIEVILIVIIVIILIRHSRRMQKCGTAHQDLGQMDEN